MEKFFIKTYGCQMNTYDSEKISNILLKIGYIKNDDFDGSDLIIFNTCHIRDKATERMYSELGKVKIYKEGRLKYGKDTILIITGCVAQAEGIEMFKRAGFIDIVIGPESYSDLEKVIYSVKSGRKRVVSLDFKTEQKFDFLNTDICSSECDTPSSLVSIQEGCNKFCAFCVVPYTRGFEASRKVDHVMKEIELLVKNGAKEIILLGQNVNAYHGVDEFDKQWNLGQLIAKIAQIDEIKRIRYTTSHPIDMHADLIAMHASEPKLMPILNLPVQSGSDNILKKMNRKHNRKYYIDLMFKIKSVRPDIIFSSDFIVGFPSETEEDFEFTMDLVRQIKFESQSFSFKYSQRIGTPAAEMEQISDEIASERLDKLQDLLDSQRMSFNQKMLGKVVKVLFDNKAMRRPNQIGGRTEFLQIVIVNLLDQKEKEYYFGKIFDVKILKIDSNSMIGEIV